MYQVIVATETTLDEVDELDKLPGIGVGRQDRIPHQTGSRAGVTCEWLNVIGIVHLSKACQSLATSNNPFLFIVSWTKFNDMQAVFVFIKINKKL